MGAEGQGRVTASGVASPGSGFGGLAVFFPAVAGLRGRGGGSPAGGTPPPPNPGPRVEPHRAPRAQGPRGGEGRDGSPRAAARGPGAPWCPRQGGTRAAPPRKMAGVGRACPRPPLRASSAQLARGRAPPARGWATSVSAPDGRDPRSAGGWGWGTVPPQPRSHDIRRPGPLPSAPRPARARDSASFWVLSTFPVTVALVVSLLLQDSCCTWGPPAGSQEPPPMAIEPLNGGNRGTKYFYLIVIKLKIKQSIIFL